MKQPLKILVLEDKLTDVAFIQNELDKSGIKFELKAVDTKLAFINALDSYKADVILANHTCKQFHSTEALEIIKNKQLAIPFILVTDSVNETFAVSILKLGAADYILKNNLSRLAIAIEAAMTHKQQVDGQFDLKKSEEKYRSLVERVSDAIVSLDINWNYTYVNKLAAEIFDREADSLIGKHIWTEFPEGVGQPFYLAYQKAIETQTNQYIEEYYPFYDKYFENHIYPSAEGLTIYFKDITENKKREEALLNSESKFRSLTSNAPVGIFQTNIEGECNFVNEEWMKYAGMTFEEAMGIGWSNAIHPEDKERVFVEWQSAVDSGEVFTSEFRFQSKTGKTTWINSKAATLTDDDGKTIGYIGVAKDITQRKEAEEKLQQSESLARGIFNSNIIGFTNWNANGDIIDANDFFLKTFGYTRQDILDGNLHWDKMTPPEYAERDQLALKEVAETGVFLPYEKEYIAKDGRRIPILIGAALIEEEISTKGVAYVMDITERKKAEAQRVSSDKRFRALVENNEGIITLLDANLKTIFRSKSNSKVTGWTFDEYETISTDEYVHPEDLDNLKSTMLEALANPGKTIHSTARIRHKDGHYIWTEGTFKNMLHDSAIKGIVANMKDVTERKNAEEKLKQSQNLTSAIFNSKVIGFFYFDANGEIIDANEFFLKTFGYSKQDLLDGKLHWGKMTPPEYEERDQLALKELAETGLCLPFEKVFIAKDGSQIPIQIGGGMLQDENTTQGYAYVLDISERKKAEEALRAREQITKSIIENSNSIIYLFDTKGALLMSNKKFKEAIGFSKDFIIGKTRHDFLPKEIADQHRENDLEVIKTKKSQFYDEENIESGETHYYITAKFPLFSTDGKVYAVGGISTDVTTSKKAEEELQHTLHKLEEAQEIAGLGHWEFDMITFDRIWSKQVFKNYNFKVRTELPKTEEILEHTHPEDRNIVNSAVEKAWQGIQTENFIIRTNPEFGPLKYLLNIWQLVYNEAGEAIKLNGTVQDITERKKAEEALQYTLHILEEAQEISGLGHWEIDLSTSKRIWSKQVFKNFNFPLSAEAPDTATVREHVHPEDRDLMMSSFEMITQGGQPASFIMKTNPEFGPLKYLLSSWHLMHNDNGEVKKMIGTSQDITNVKEIELKLIAHNAALQKANAELDRFVYSASHDLRAPLKSMLGLADLLQLEMNSDDSEQSMLIDMIKKSVLKLDDFVEDILDYSRNARVDLQLKELNFEEIIEEIRGNHKFMEGAKDVTLKLDIQLETAFISDVSRVKIILNNLISNAVKYHDFKNNDSFVLIKIRCNKTKAQIEVTDNGIGIAQKDHEVIFNMFHRATSLSTGSGLGLYIVSEALTKLDGSIELKSELGKGSTFSLTIPNAI